MGRTLKETFGRITLLPAHDDNGNVLGQAKRFAPFAGGAVGAVLAVLLVLAPSALWGSSDRYELAVRGAASSALGTGAVNAAGGVSASTGETGHEEPGSTPAGSSSAGQAGLFGSLFEPGYRVERIDPADKLAETLVADAQNSAVPAKLEGCEETIDENGIVHGVTPSGIRYTVHGRGQLGASDDKVTLAAVGDQLITDYSLEIADGYAGEMYDYEYDFNPFYEETGPIIRQSDLRFVNQETVMATGEGYYPSGYPAFNSPDSAAESIQTQKFNLVNFATNHTYDFGTYGIERSHEVWARYPQLIVGGSFMTQQDRETVQMIERNGITFAFLCYTYGSNMWASNDDMPNTFYLCAFDDRLMSADIARAQEVADVVIVGMHWGTEYTPEPDWVQREWAQWLANKDIDLVIGTHAHTIQPVEYYTSESGKTVPVVFGLSDFISGWTRTDTIVSGIFNCDFVPNAEGAVSVENLSWTPTIEWSDGGKVYVRLLSGMDEETTNANTRTPDIVDDYTWVRDFTNSVITDIPVLWGEGQEPEGEAREEG